MKKLIKSFFGEREDFKDRKVKGQQERGDGGRQPRRWPIYEIIALMLVVALAILLTPASCTCGKPTPAVNPTPTVSAEVTVSINVPATVSAGGEFVAKVGISGVENFDAANYDVTYDPAVLEVTGVSNSMINDTVVEVGDLWDFIPSGVQGTVRI